MIPAESKELLSSIITQPIETWKDLLKNDFEPSVFSAHPELEEIKESIYQSGAAYASMSGSGSSIFGIFDSANMADKAKDLFKGMNAYVINL